MDGGYQAGKEIMALSGEIESLKLAVQQLYTVVEHNIKEGNLVEPKEPKKKG